MDLDQIYKSKLDHSHGAGLEAVFAAGHAKAREEFAAGLGAPESPPAAPEGDPSDGDETQVEEDGETETSEDAEAAAHSAA